MGGRFWLDYCDRLVPEHSNELCSPLAMLLLARRRSVKPVCQVLAETQSGRDVLKALSE